MKLVIEIADNDAACLFKDEWDGNNCGSLKDSIEGDVRGRAEKYRSAFSQPAPDVLETAGKVGFLPHPLVRGLIEHAPDLLAFLESYVANKTCDLRDGFITQCWHCDAKELLAKVKGGVA